AEHRWVDLAAGGLPCSPVVVAVAASAPAACPAAELLLDEPRGRWGVWRWPCAVATPAPSQ
ncbi:MAG TPA: hypothetical protein VK866_04845, partial [Acidimicrobiales bacterium]|nr:hypothetical protein [Acidimicrobiales bacterium]